MKDSIGITSGFEPQQADETESEWEKAVSQLVEKGGEMEQLRSMMPAVKDSAALISQADFIKSSFRLEDCPPTKGLPEIAVVGMSNVGKSSLINAMTENPDLAYVSKHPGRTQCINHFLINGNWFLVDLPGYGYARVSEEIRDIWGQFTVEYFLNRRNLAHVLLLVDSALPM